MFPLSPLPNCDKTSFFIQLPAKILLPSYAHIMHYIDFKIVWDAYHILT